ncbi:hypothetical protein TNCT_614271 [Trichonephila clavata]|uniref:Uncharacterized protein n=1 Tax=Trichonephila clavata TaxID=2740835 RepID=A0A8X6KM83_TRICU|nr:hypothetical protein TNCT_614271 [Trichonephila clavata]
MPLVAGTHSACRWNLPTVNIFEKAVKKCVSGSPQTLILHTNDTTRRDFPTKSRKDNGEMRYLEKRPCDKIAECHRLFSVIDSCRCVLNIGTGVIYGDFKSGKTSSLNPWMCFKSPRNIKCC